MTLTRALARPAVAATVLTCVAALALAGCTDQPKDTANRPAASTSSGTPSAAADESTESRPDRDRHHRVVGLDRPGADHGRHR